MLTPIVCQKELEHYSAKSYMKTLFHHTTSRYTAIGTRLSSATTHQRETKMTRPTPARYFSTTSSGISNSSVWTLSYHSSNTLLNPYAAKRNSSVHQEPWTACKGKSQLVLSRAYRPTPHTITPCVALIHRHETRNKQADKNSILNYYGEWVIHHYHLIHPSVEDPVCLPVPSC